jgi:hypothetical protein
MSRKFFAAATLLFAAISAPVKADLVIDNFDSGPQSIAIQSGSSSDVASGLPTSDVLGGERDVQLTVNSNPGNLFTAIEIIPTLGVFTLSNDAFVSSTAVLRYFGPGTELTPPVNLTSFGGQFSFDIISVDLTLSLSLQIFSAGGATQAVTLSNLSAGVLNIGFDEFDSVDLTQVTGIQITLIAPDNADFVADSFGVTEVAAIAPEPSSFALGLAGIALLGFRKTARAVRKKFAA